MTVVRTAVRTVAEDASANMAGPTSSSSSPMDAPAKMAGPTSSSSSPMDAPANMAGPTSAISSPMDEKAVIEETKEEVPDLKEDILSVHYWKNSKTFRALKNKETQIKYYQRMKSSEEVLQLVGLDSKPFGSESEKIIQEVFGLGPRTSSQNDGTRLGKKIEIKSARYWAGKDDCRWQHLEPDHDYEIVLFVLLDFHGWKVWGMPKSLLMGEMRDKKIVTFQGKQGWWVTKSDILSYLTPIQSRQELDHLLRSL